MPWQLDCWGHCCYWWGSHTLVFVILWSNQVGSDVCSEIVSHFILFRYRRSLKKTNEILKVVPRSPLYDKAVAHTAQLLAAFLKFLNYSMMWYQALLSEVNTPHMSLLCRPVFYYRLSTLCCNQPDLLFNQFIVGVIVAWFGIEGLSAKMLAICF